CNETVSTSPEAVLTPVALFSQDRLSLSRRLYMLSRLLFLAAALGLQTAVSVLPVNAASFDCAKATTPFEKAICGDAELSKADERLARTYQTAIGGLSEAALSAMRADQRAW